MDHSFAATSGGGMQQSQQAPPISYDQSAALTFHHTDYLLHACVRYTQPQSQQQDAAGSPAAAAASPYAHSPPMPILLIEAEQRDNGHRWTGEFSAKYIEEMSLKTGNFKKFSLFLKMLSSALSKSSETVFIDLLTFQDLEALKQRKQAASSGPNAQPHTLRTQQQAATAAVAAAQNKRYIILTYVAEFDKVHYPLPLKFESDPSPVLLKQTIARLRSEIDLLRSGSGAGNGLGASSAQAPPAAAQPSAAHIDKYKAEIYRLAEENHRLQTTLNARGAGTENGSSGAAATAAASTSSSLSTLELEQLHIDLRSAQSQASRLQSENADLSRKLHGLMQGAPLESLGLQMSLDGLSKQVWNLQAELAAEQSLHAKARHKHDREQDVMLKELEKRLEAERMLRNKCRLLTQQLEEMHEAQQPRAQTRTAGGSARAGSAARLGSSGGSTDSIRGGGAQRRPVFASSPGGGRGTSAGRPLSRPPSRPSSRPTSAASSRSNSPAPSSATAFGTSSGRTGRAASPAGSARGGGAGAGAGGGARSRSPSPAAFGRFDPSAYVKHKQVQLAKQQQRQSAHNRDMRSGRERSLSPAPAPHAAAAAAAPSASASVRSRSPVMRSGSARNSLSLSADFSPRGPSRSSSNTSLSSTSPYAPAASRRSPRGGAGAGSAAPLPPRRADAMPPRVPTTRAARPASASVRDRRDDDNEEDHDSAAVSDSPSSSSSSARGAAANSRRAPTNDSDLDESVDRDEQAFERDTASTKGRPFAPARRSARDADSEEEDEEPPTPPRKSAASHKKSAVTDNIEERFSALQNFLKSQKVDNI